MSLRISILYVEDDVLDVESVLGVLTEFGSIFDIRHVIEWEDVKDDIDSNRFDVVIFGIHNIGNSMDSMMSLHEYSPNLPILATGSELNMETVSMAIKGGARVYLPRPFNSRRLLAIIKKAVNDSS